MKTYYVYLLANERLTVFYTGVTNDILRRTLEHKTKFNRRSFTAQFNCDRLMYYEKFDDINEVIHREKQLKKYARQWKIELIEKMNPEWKDLWDEIRG